jgi:F-type H+-transporting ATPase subunit a
MINVNLQSEYIFSLFGLSVTNTFYTSVLVTLLLVIFSINFYLHQRDHQDIIINSLRVVIYELLKLTDNVTQNRRLSKKILPVITTFFLFIVTANLLALIPGFLGSFFVLTPDGEVALLRSPNSDLTTTLALAIISVLSIQLFSIQALGIGGYLKRFINFSGPISFVLGFFEMVSEVVKIFSFSFRLFGNIFAGEILLLVIAFLTPYIIPVPFMILELFVGIIQAFIFSILTLTFIKTSTLRHLGSPAKSNK